MRRILAWFSSIALLASCEEYPADIHQILETDHVVIGDLRAPGILYSDLSPGIFLNPPAGERQSLAIDLNKDSINDLRIESRSFVIASDTIADCSIASMGNLRISTFETTDAYYSYTDTSDNNSPVTYYVSDSRNLPQAPTVINIRPAHYCTMYAQGDTIYNNQPFNGIGSLFTWERYGRDTTSEGYPLVFELHLGAWSGAGPTYAAFSFTHENDFYLGWIKLEVINYNSIVIYQYAYRRITKP